MTIRRHWAIIFLALGLLSTLLLTYLAGTTETIAILRNANFVFIAGIVLLQTLRYLVMAVSTKVVSEIVKVRVPLAQMFLVVVAAQAANRVFVGGAAGVLIRGAYLIRRGMHPGVFAAVEGIEAVVSLCAVALMFLAGVAFVVTREGSALRLDVIGVVIGGAVVLAGLAIAIVRRRALVEQIADVVGRGAFWVWHLISRKAVYHAERVRGAVNDFYSALELARQDPTRVMIAFGCAFARLGSDWIALYFAFRSTGTEIPLGTVLLIFIVSTSIATVAIVPGQIGVMEGTLAFMSTALGVPLPAAVVATLLFRLVSFWLPIPFGYAFAWALDRRGLV